MSCNNCKTNEKIDEPFNVCARCQKTKYCSKKCQKEDWKRHKVICKKCTKHDIYFCIDEDCKRERISLLLIAFY